MNNLLDNLGDYLRVLDILVCSFCVFVLLKRYRTGGAHWNLKTHDYWFSCLMWCISGLILSIQGITLDYPFGPAIVFVTAAALVTGRGLHRKGAWGGDR